MSRCFTDASLAFLEFLLLFSHLPLFLWSDFSLAVYKGIFSCCLTEDSGLMLMPNSNFFKTCFLFSSFFHTYNFHGVWVQSRFAYAGGGVSFSLFLLLFCSPFLSQLLHHYDFCTFSLVLFRTFFFSLSLSVPLSCYFLHVFCGGAASSGIFLFILFHFFLFLHSALRVTWMMCVSIHAHL